MNVRLLGFFAGQQFSLVVRGVERALGGCADLLFDFRQLCFRRVEAYLGWGGGVVGCDGRKRGVRSERAFIASVFSHRGPRPNNEDSAVVAAVRVGDFRYAFVAVADGVGGLERGEVASSYAVRAALCGVLQSLAAGREVSFHELFWDIHRFLEVAGGGGATTLTAALLYPDGTLQVANVGDTAALLVRGVGAYRLTPLDKLPDGGHVITQALGKRLEEVHENIYRLSRGDVVVVATDGVTDVLHDGHVVAAVRKLQKRKTAAAEIAKTLVDWALRSGTGDNATAAVLIRAK